MDFKDYYEILGILPTAEKKDVQKAYRQLARKHHPDVNPGNKEAEENFKAINEANQVLSDPKKRKKYDELRAEYQQWQKTGGRQQDFDWQDWSAQQQAPRSSGGSSRVQYANADDLKDIFGDDSPYSDFFSSLFGQAGRPNAKRNAQSAASTARRGRDVEYKVDLSLLEAYQGTQRLLELNGRRIKAGIPAGVRTGSRVRLAGQAEPGSNGGPAGDLYLFVEILANATFEREGDNLHMDLPVDFFTAILGGEVQVPGLEKKLILKIPPRTNAGQTFRLRGKGMPKLGDPQTHGDMFAKTRLVLPDPLTEQDVIGIRELAASRLNTAKNIQSEAKT